MSILDKKHILTIDLDASSIEYSKKIFFYNTDKNISNLYVKIKKNNDDGVGVELSATDLTDVIIKLTAIKPKTIQTKDMTGVLTEELTDQSCAIYKFELLSEFTDQVGLVVCEFELSNSSGEIVTIDAFSYEIKASKLTGLNGEIIANPDLPILKSLIEEVKNEKLRISNINDLASSETETYSSSQIENIKSELVAQYNTIENGLKLVANGNVVKLMLGNKELSSIIISGGNVGTSHTITNNLSNASNSNSYSNIAENESYIATISANSGYKLNTVVITMGGTNITSTVYSNGNINIPSVTGGIVITVTTIINTDTVVGSIDTSKNISLTGLATGTYTLKYENETGILSDFDIIATMGV